MKKNEPENKVFSNKLALALILIAAILLVALLGVVFGLKLHKNNDDAEKSGESEGNHVILYILYKNEPLAMTLLALLSNYLDPRYSTTRWMVLMI